jgi:hypothetical protein
MLMSGQVLSARYVLVRQLGAGGGGSVWLAQDRELRCLVALKVLAAELVQNVAAVQALQRECERTAVLRHPNILQVAGLERSPAGVWIVMEYAAGGDLTQLRGGTTRAVLRATIPVANALDYAHRAGVVHRDLKPANVVLMSDGTPRVADFGTALLLAEAPAATAGRGSAYNMSPQQLAGAPAAVADDVYAFGALLYELLSGYPPFYPDISEAHVRAAEPAPLADQGSVLSGLSELVKRCLQKAPEQRPATMRCVEQELTTILSQLPAPTTLSEAPRSSPPHVTPPVIRAPLSHGEPLRGEWQRSNQTGPDAAELRRQGFRRGLFAAALALSVIAVGVVFIALPKWVASESTKASQPTATAQTPALPVAEPEKKAVDFAELARAKQQSEEQRAALEERMKKLLARAVGQWGAEDLSVATVALADGDRHFAAREYVLANEKFTSVEPVLQRLERRATEVLAEQLEAGAAALADGRSTAARDAFALAQKLDPRNQAASAGLKRATTLDEVLKILAQAERAEKDGDLTSAAIGFRKALALDSQTARASEGLARTQSRIAGNSFASAMAQGFSAITRADYAAARSAFESAGKLRPGAPEVAQALRQVEQDERTRTITAKLATAGQFEKQEKWAEALQEYQGVVQLDSTVAAANDGIARTKPRAELHQQLEIYLTQPERLFSAPVRSTAKDTLDRARAIAGAGPILTKQMATLAEWLARAEVPVPVALQSDNITQVTIRRVADLGAFEQRSLELAPGSYIVVGTRPGYRDVRREITVVPGMALAPLVIRCEEKI